MPLPPSCWAWGRVGLVAGCFSGALAAVFPLPPMCDPGYAPICGCSGFSASSWGRELCASVEELLGAGALIDGVIDGPIDGPIDGDHT